MVNILKNTTWEFPESGRAEIQLLPQRGLAVAIDPFKRNGLGRVIAKYEANSRDTQTKLNANYPSVVLHSLPSGLSTVAICKQSITVGSGILGLPR